MKRKYYWFLLTALVLFVACDTGENELAEETSLTGTYWWWPSLQLFFISDDRVMLYSTGPYYPYSGYPFHYNYPAQGYAYSYTYNPATKRGSINDLHEYNGGPLGSFKYQPEKEMLFFPNYKGYGHGADFKTLRPAPAAGYSFRSLPPGLHGTIWQATVPGTGFGDYDGYLVLLHFYNNADYPNKVFVSRTYDVDTDAEKQREYSFSVSGAAGTITGIGGFTIDASANTIAFPSFPGIPGNTVFERIQ